MCVCVGEVSHFIKVKKERKIMNDTQVVGLREALVNSETVMVEFTKANGDVREMVAVLNPEVVGVVWEYKGGSSPADENDDLQVVFDIESNGFRSFKYSNVTNWSVAD